MKHASFAISFGLLAQAPCAVLIISRCICPLSMYTQTGTDSMAQELRQQAQANHTGIESMILSLPTSKLPFEPCV